MIHYLRLLATCIFVFSFYSSLFACSCNAPPVTFDDTLYDRPGPNGMPSNDPRDSVQVGLVRMIGFSNYKYYINSEGQQDSSALSADFVVLQRLRGSSVVVGDTITLLGSDGVNCGRWLGDLVPDSIFIIQHPYLDAPNEAGFNLNFDLVTPYKHSLLFGCGESLLRVIDGVVRGPISRFLGEMTLDAFIEELEPFVESVSTRSELWLPDLEIFPLPVRNELTLRWENPEVNSLELVGLDGRRIIYRQLSSGTQRTQLTLSWLPAGLYFIRLSNGLATNIQKIVVIR